MALTEAEDRLLAAALNDARGDGAVRDALVGFIAEKLGFSRSGGTPTGRLLVQGAATGFAADLATTQVEEYGDGISHVTRLTMTDFQVHAVEPSDEDLAVGATFYTLPAGYYLIESASLIGSFTKAGEATIADGEIAIGTLIGSGAVDTTGEVDAAAENVLEPIVLSSSEFDGAAVFASVSVPNLYIAASGGLARSLFLNVAATWPEVTPDDPDLGIRFTGVITVKWRKLN